MNHVGSDFNAFLQDANIYFQTKALAVKKILAHKIGKEMRKQKISKTRMAKLMHTSRSSLDRLLEPDNAAVTLDTLVKAACVLNTDLNVTFGKATHSTRANLAMSRKKVIAKKK